MKRLVLDLDNTLTIDSDLPYSEKLPNHAVIERCREYKKMGFEIIIFTARNMRTYGANNGKIAAKTLPGIIDWLDNNAVPYDEIFIGKPWCGYDGFYVDDKALRPSEFLALSHSEILELISREGQIKSQKKVK